MRTAAPASLHATKIGDIKWFLTHMLALVAYFFSMKWPFSSQLSSARDESLIKKESIAVSIAQELKALLGAGAGMVRGAGVW